MTSVGASGGIRIGSGVLFGPDVVVSSEPHNFELPDIRVAAQGVRRCGVVVEDGCWIASRAVILDGVTVGAGAVVAAGAVVTRNVPAGSVVAGVPALVVKYRGNLLAHIESASIDQ